MPEDLHDAGSLAIAQEAIGLSFNDPGLLKLALTHTSIANERPEAHGESNERLEFLGDGVVNLVVARSLYSRAPDAKEGELTVRRASAVNRDALASAAKRLGLGEHLAMGHGEDASGGRERRTNLANAFEALAAAVFIDRGFDECERAVLEWLGPEIDEALRLDSPKDPKSRLQEALQQRGSPPPKYRVVSLDDVEHDSRFTVEAIVEGAVAGTGSGSRKVDAERSAAMEALRNNGLAQTLQPGP